MDEKKFAKQSSKQLIPLIDVNPYAALLMLARLQAAQTAVSQQALATIESQLTSAHMSKLHHELVGITPIQLRFIDPSNTQAIHQVKQAFLRQPQYFKLLTYEQLISLAAQKRYHREVMIALIRKFTISRQVDPFAEHFSYALLNQGGVEQNYLYLSSFIDKCKTLPFEKLQTIGQDKTNAMRMLQDMSNTQHYFPLSVKLLALHPSLANTIAKAWQYRLETTPLIAKENAFVKSALPILQKKYNAFKPLKLDKRTLRGCQFEVPQTTPTRPISWLNPLGAGLASYALPQVVNHAKDILSLSSALFSGGTITTAFAAYCASSVPALAPLGVYAGLSYFARRYTHR